MKKMITLVAILAITSMSAMAQSRTRVSTRATIGSDIIRIDINNRSRRNITLAQRVRRLERAVIQLQDTIYDLQDGQNNPQILWTCSVQTNINSMWSDTYYGDTLTSKGAAQRSAHTKCTTQELDDSVCSNSNSRLTCTRE